MRRANGPFSRLHRRLVIFDQLHPAWARYCTGEEAVSVLEEVGFVDVRAHRRHDDSWSIVGTRPLPGSVLHPSMKPGAAVEAER